MEKLVAAKESKVNELIEKLKAYEEKFSEAGNKIKDYEAQCDRLRKSRNGFRDMVNKVQSKNAEEIAGLERKHAEEVATLTEESAVFVENHKAVAT